MTSNPDLQKLVSPQQIGSKNYLKNPKIFVEDKCFYYYFESYILSL